MPPTLTTLDDALAYLGIVRLHAAYADVTTRRSWVELRDLFLPDAKVTLHLRTSDPLEFVGPDAIGGFIAQAIDQFEFFEFVVLNSVVDVAADGRTATGRMYMQELRQGGASGRWTVIYGVYHDTYEHLAGGWRFAGRDYYSLARTSPDMDVFPIPEAR
jgi:hypothetical protein